MEKELNEWKEDLYQKTRMGIQNNILMEQELQEARLKNKAYDHAVD